MPSSNECKHLRTQYEPPDEARKRWDAGESDLEIKKKCLICHEEWLAPSDKAIDLLHEEKLKERQIASVEQMDYQRRKRSAGESLRLSRRRDRGQAK